MHDEERSERPSIIMQDLVELVQERIMENLCFTITELSSHFPQISQSKANGVSIDISAAVP